MANFHFSPRPNRAHEIQWRAWGEQAFAQARQQDKPVLLDIGAVWCHWCHVMDETTYSDPVVIQLANERFIPVRVENDERPDVNRRYNLGGWPTTAFLSPEGELLTGGTYIPPEQMHGYLTQVSDAYKNSKSKIQERIAEINAERAQAYTTRAASDASLSPDIIANVLHRVRENFDSLYGGFGNDQKFPQTDALEFALEQYWKSGDPSLLPVVTLTLTNMAGGGMYDQVWGGFFRYSTTRDWTVPHYEKMLEDNARLLKLYLHAWQVTGDDSYLKTARSTLAYADLTLGNHARGGFYGSQDADETYYTLPLEQRQARPAPYVDHTLYTDWNALMISAYLAGAPLGIAGPGEGEPDLSKFALKTLDRLWTEMYRPGEGLYHYLEENGTPQLLNQLSDLARTTAALLDAYEFTGDIVHLQRAQALADLALQTVYDAETGSFWSEPPGEENIGLLRVPDKSMNENASMADTLTRLARLTGNDKYRDAAEKALAYFASDYERYSYMAADYARAVDHFLTEPVSVHVVGAAGDARARALEWSALQVYAPDKTIQWLDPARDAARLAQLGYPPDGGQPRAYVCVGQTCLPPTSDVKAVAEGMKKLK